LCARAAAGAPPEGSLAVVDVAGVLELSRVVEVDGTGRLRVLADAEIGPGRWVGAEALVATVATASRVPGSWTRLARALLRDHREAAGGARWDTPGAEHSVRAKYDVQAPVYREWKLALAPDVAECVRRFVPPDGRVFVAGCGAGGECLALAASGLHVAGIDFAPAMAGAAREAASAAGLPIRVVEGDVLEHDEPPASLDLVLFTYEVYSFLSDAGKRVALLRRMRRWLRPNGVLALSARLVRRPYQRWILTLAWLAARARGQHLPWGACHTRWIAADGRVHRSFVHYFTRRELDGEIARAGLWTQDVTAGHLWLSGAREAS
jgi:SAM-dependent methyltransferase